MGRARYEVVADVAGEPLLIRDVGPWDRYMSVTNAAEEVVAGLHAEGRLPAGRLLYYYDSEGQVDQLKHDGRGFFQGFGPGPAS